jgi:hypothetical protein
MARGNFGGGGGTDVAVSLESGALLVLLGDVSLGLVPLEEMVVATAEPVSLTALDVNRDATDDLAIVYTFGGLQLLLGDGQGEYAVGPTFTGLELPSSVAARDVTGDGRQDVLVSERNRDAVAVFAANGTGNFTGPTRIRVGDAPRSVQSGDFDLNGGYDLAVTCVHPAVAFNRRTGARRGDVDGDGRVAAADLIALATTLPDVDCVAAERRATNGSDADGDGLVCRNDLRAVVQRIFRDA